MLFDMPDAEVLKRKRSRLGESNASHLVAYIQSNAFESESIFYSTSHPHSDTFTLLAAKPLPLTHTLSPAYRLHLPRSHSKAGWGWFTFIISTFQFVRLYLSLCRFGASILHLLCLFGFPACLCMFVCGTRSLFSIAFSVDRPESGGIRFNHFWF